ncbi:MAG: GerAB/ArcD/ProY family transporter, partial [Ruminococcaceae bacterium]|nr:GerAB/ArcD/ProY family transporter [Oscillospiraceae bacterium]
YALTRGIEGTARLSAVIALLVMVSVLFTLLPNITNFKAASLTPVYDVTGTGLCAAFIRQFIFFPELLLFVSLSGSANEEINLKSIVKFTVFSSVTIAFFFIFSEGVLGSGVFLDRLNISALSQTGEFSIFKRLDSFRLCLWVVVCASRLAAFGEGISFAFCNDRLKHKDNRNTTAAFVIIAVSALFGCIAGVKLPSEIMTAAVSVLMVVTFIVLSISAAGRKSNG